MKKPQLELTHVLSDMLATNMGPSVRKIGERVQAKYESSLMYHGGEFVATLKFLSNQSYCCMERSCHFQVASNKFWESIKAELTLHNEEIPGHFHLKLTTEIEAGAMFFDFSKPIKNHQGWYKFRTVDAATYEERFIDGTLGGSP